MYEFIRGKLAASSPLKAIVDVGGIGYSIAVGLNTYSNLPQIGEDVVFYISFVVREDAHTLYGFLTLAEREFFEQLTGVSGIGPKTAIALLGHLDLIDLQMAILHGNIALISKSPGIGKKTAERLVVEMRDKIKQDKAVPAHPLEPGQKRGVIGDAISALINLGYHPIEAQKAVKKISSDLPKDPDLGRLITAALKVL
jgi:Holliday junction DNA helicase RuvA